MDRGHDSANSYSENLFQCTFVSWQSPQPLICKETCQKICQQRLYWCDAAIQTDHSKDHCIHSFSTRSVCPFSQQYISQCLQKHNLFLFQPPWGLCELIVSQNVHPVFQSKCILFSFPELLLQPCPTDMRIYHREKHDLFHLGLFYSAVSLCVVVLPL